MTEPFDAVLADIRRCAVGWFAIPALANTMGKLADRLAAAHAAEKEAAERDARELRDTLREARRWIGDGDMGDGMHRSIWTPAYTAIVDRVDAAIAATEAAHD